MGFIESRRKLGVVSLLPKGEIRGVVLLSYLIDPFFKKSNDDPAFFAHTNMWECKQMAQTFLDFNYKVDVINWNNQKFTPKQKYSFFIDIHSNLERLVPFLDRDCIRILHITGAHWLFQNRAEYARLLALQQRRGITLIPRRLVLPSLGIEYADCATTLGNQFTISTFSYVKKPIYRVPISASVLYPFPEDKDYEACRSRFLWFGSSGMVHKGLDLVLEAFAEMPEYHLTVCGPVKNEKDFESAFFKELYQTPNIHTIGWIDVSSPKFQEITKNCIGLIYPSCSEGGGGSVVTCLHAGLIPIVSIESSVDINDFGITLKDCTVDEIKKSVKILSGQSVNELKLRVRKAWEYARAHHTREQFTLRYEEVVQKIIARYDKH